MDLLIDYQFPDVIIKTDGTFHICYKWLHTMKDTLYGTKLAFGWVL